MTYLPGTNFNGTDSFKFTVTDDGTAGAVAPEVEVGDVVIVEAVVNGVGRSSVEVGVEVYAELPGGGERRHTNSCLVTMVAVDEQYLDMPDASEMPMPLDPGAPTEAVPPTVDTAAAALVGLALGALSMLAVSWIFRRSTPRGVDSLFRKLQLVSAALFSLGHGSNDAQKSMGVITLALASYGAIHTFHIPAWVILSCAASMALGTAMGGWRIIKTVGDKIYRHPTFYRLPDEVNHM